MFSFKTFFKGKVDKCFVNSISQHLFSVCSMTQKNIGNTAANNHAISSSRIKGLSVAIAPHCHMVNFHENSVKSRSETERIMTHSMFNRIQREIIDVFCQIHVRNIATKFKVATLRHANAVFVHLKKKGLNQCVKSSTELRTIIFLKCSQNLVCYH